ncbi:undecaprenyl-phosphate galactose phosphotransferase WbaP [Bythopirellula polymerisocia]|nr:undecaprenyl-phosphate galactose phosphotransferase WbaP [Bythopirellula polymerisocia]
MPRHRASIKTNVRSHVARAHGDASYVRQLLLTTLPLVVADLAVLFIVPILVSLTGYSWLNPDDPTSTAMTWFIPASIAYVLLNATQGLYPGVCLGLVDEIRRLFLSIGMVTLVLAATLRIGSPIFAHRLVFLLAVSSLMIVLAPIVRSYVRRKLGAMNWWGFPTLVCGNDATVFGVREWIEANRRLGLRTVGVIADPSAIEINGDAPWFIGEWDDARHVAEEQDVYWAVVVETDRDQQSASSLVENYLGNIPHAFVVSDLTGIPTHWSRHQMDEGLAGFMIEQHLLLPIPKLVKRGMDITICMISLILLLPLFVSLAIAIKLTSKGPVFYGHERVGKGDTRFKAWKFRTMINGAEQLIEEYLQKHPQLREEWEREHKLRNDPRVTGLGKFMRKWSIDELPQLWNVLAGEMSIVGPRPIVPNEIETYGIHYEAFCTVLPGITGLWQVCGRNDTTFDERIQLGMFYIHHWSLWLDFYLMFRTVGTVLFTKGAY